MRAPQPQHCSSERPKRPKQKKKLSSRTDVVTQVGLRREVRHRYIGHDCVKCQATLPSEKTREKALFEKGWSRRAVTGVEAASMNRYLRNTLFIGVLVGVVVLTTNTPGLLRERMMKNAVANRPPVDAAARDKLRKMRGD
jgi:hypothetical protein